MARYLDAAAVVKAITEGGGKVILTDENGGVSTVLVTDLKADNGVIHVIDSVVLPK